MVYLMRRHTNLSASERMEWRTYTRMGLLAVCVVCLAVFGVVRETSLGQSFADSVTTGAAEAQGLTEGTSALGRALRVPSAATARSLRSLAGVTATSTPSVSDKSPTSYDDFTKYTGGGNRTGPVYDLPSICYGVDVRNPDLQQCCAFAVFLMELEANVSAFCPQTKPDHFSMFPTDAGYMVNRDANVSNWDEVVMPNYYDPLMGRGSYTCAQLGKGGMAVLYLVGIMYMFLALAVVCDEFFVPCLEMIVERIGMSDDVAGATFMAAGGSAPELFTSFIGTFLAMSNVGFGTIVGSAVFNVLFVIGCCAIFSKEELELTWWPLFRDCTYYTISLLVLSICFGFGTTCQDDSSMFKLKYPLTMYEKALENVPNVSSKASHYLSLMPTNSTGLPACFSDGNFIEWWEALILLCMYIGYVTIMAFQDNIHDRVIACTGGEKVKPRFRVGFTAGIMNMMINDQGLEGTKLSVNLVANLGGDVEATFKKVDKDNSGTIDSTELAQVMKELGSSWGEGDEKKALDEMDMDGDGVINKSEFAQWYVKSEAGLERNMKDAFTKVDKDGSGDIDKEELRTVLKLVGPEPSDKVLDDTMKELDNNQNGKVTQDAFEAYYKDKLMQQTQDLLADEEDKYLGIWPKFPETCSARVYYIVNLPLIFLLYLVIPYPTFKNKPALCYVGFFMSIFMIAIFSYFMVWWATVCGDLVGISPAVMGLTFLAAGTSVPDLLTSVLVARKGLGDMAVSSSIGSNIFDVLIGLPLPWFIWTLANDQPMLVTARTLPTSVLILLGVLVLVVLTIAASGWKMSKILGAIMFLMYVAFLVQDLVRGGLDSGLEYCKQNAQVGTSQYVGTPCTTTKIGGEYVCI